MGIYAAIEGDATIRIRDNDYAGYRIRVRSSFSEAVPRGSTLDVLWRDLGSGVTPFRRVRPQEGQDVLIFVQRLWDADGIAYELVSPTMAYDQKMFLWPPAQNVGNFLPNWHEADIIVAVTVRDVDGGGTNRVVVVAVEEVYRFTSMDDFSPTVGSFGTVEILWFPDGELPTVGDRYIVYLRREDESKPPRWLLKGVLDEEVFRWPPGKELLEMAEPRRTMPF